MSDRLSRANLVCTGDRLDLAGLQSRVVLAGLRQAVISQVNVVVEIQDTAVVPPWQLAAQ